MIGAITNAGPLPVLELTLKFAGARQRLLAHNIANISTPDFRPLDVDPAAFQDMLADAIDDRRDDTKPDPLQWEWDETRQIRRGDDGSLVLDPHTPSGNILFHDRNNRDVERMMQSLAENAATYRVAVDLIQQHTTLIHNALAERVA